MRVLAWVLGGLVLLVVLVFGAQLVVSETGEVVVLHTRDGDTVSTTRLWVVEDDGVLWLRAGGGTAQGWYQRLLANPEVELERGTVRANYLTLPEPERNARINALMAEKYGWRDRIIGLLAADRSDSIPVRLMPVDETPAGS